MFTRTNGLIGAVVGLVLALVGLVAWLALNHHKAGIGLLVVGVLLLGLGIYAVVSSGRAQKGLAS